MQFEKVLFLCLSLLLISCKKNINSDKYSYDSKLSDSIYFDLCQIYQDSSIVQLKEFVNKWSQRYRANPNYKLEGEDLTSYKIYKEFYSPYNLSRIGGCEWNEVNKEVKYLIIQNSINIDKCIKDNQRSYRYTTINFRPNLDFGDSIKLLYLSAEYDTAINKFLKSEFLPVGTGNFMNPSQPKDESYNRYLFLKSYLNIYPGHWGGYWQIETPPTIDYIDFSFAKLFATVHFTLIYEGGEARFVNIFGRWKMISSKRTWIE